jgi:hypothetical protein
LQIVKSIGRHGSPWTPDTARTKARELLGVVAGGADPFAQSLSSETLGAEIERYLDRKKASLKPRSFIETARHLRKYALPLHKLRLADIDRRTIAVLLGQIETASGPSARNRLRSSLSAFYAWAIQEGLTEINPVQGTGVRGGACVITKRLPERGGEFEYRVKSVNEPHERVVRESQLATDL